MNSSGNNNQVGGDYQPQPIEAEVTISSPPSVAESTIPIGPVAHRHRNHDQGEQVDDNAYDDAENTNRGASVTALNMMIMAMCQRHQQRSRVVWRSKTWIRPSKHNI